MLMNCSRINLEMILIRGGQHSAIKIELKRIFQRKDSVAISPSRHCRTLLFRSLTPSSTTSELEAAEEVEVLECKFKASNSSIRVQQLRRRC